MNKQKSKRLVLGEGETIGHKHVLESQTEMSYSRLKESLHIMLKNMGIVTHDEHDRIVLSKGRHRSYNQVEFNPMDGSIDRVFD